MSSDRPPRRPGRKPKAPELVRDYVVTGHVTSADHDVVRRLQRALGDVSESHVVRTAVLEFAKKVLP